MERNSIKNNRPHAHARNKLKASRSSFIL
jgi:hypothetical protein